MLIRVLGSAAGGGFPQWNCGCALCRRARSGEGSARPRTQSSAAVSADGEVFFLLDASPEIRAQIEACPPLWPRGLRGSPIAGVLLDNGDLDHCLGLLSLREGHRFRIYATERVRRGFTVLNVLYRTLERSPDQVTWRRLALGLEAPLLRPDGAPSGLSVTAVAVPGKVPLHLAGCAAPHPEDNVAFHVREQATGRSMLYAPSVGGPVPALEPLLREADVVFFDGTFWSSDELTSLGIGKRRAEDMAHWPVEESLPVLAASPARRRILTHVNNTNPILIDGSPERRALAAGGIEVAFDGMEVVL